MGKQMTIADVNGEAMLSHLQTETGLKFQVFPHASAVDGTLMNAEIRFDGYTVGAIVRTYSRSFIRHDLVLDIDSYLTTFAATQLMLEFSAKGLLR